MSSLEMIQVRFDRTRSAVVQAELRGPLVRWYDARCRQMAAVTKFMQMVDRVGGGLPQGSEVHAHGPAADSEEMKRLEGALCTWLAALETDANAPADDLINSLQG